MRRRLFTLTALLSLPACAGGDEDRNGAAFRVDTVAGVPHAISRGEPPVWQLVRERVIGSLGGAGESAAPDEFAAIRWLSLDREGNVYVADGGVRQIQGFDTAGVHLRTVGRRGSGPGEFGSLQATAFLGDTLVVMDPVNGRLALLDRAGNQLGQWPMGRLTGRARWFHPLAADTVAMMDLIPVGGGREQAYVFLGMSGPIDTILAATPADREVVVQVTCDTHDGSIHFWSDPLAPSPLAVPAPGQRLVVGWSDAYRLPFVSAAGDTVLVVERQDGAAAVPDSMRQRLDAEYRVWRDGLPFGASCDPPDRGGYTVLPPVEHVAFDEGGRMWVETLSAEGRAWEIFSAEGRLLGRAPVPARHEAVHPAIREGRVAVVEEAPEGHHRVVVYRLVEGG